MLNNFFVNKCYGTLGIVRNSQKLEVMTEHSKEEYTSATHALSLLALL